MFDAIVIGSGMSGGIAAKELCERGLKVLVLERGNEVVHRRDYMDGVMPWDSPNGGMIPQEELERDYAVQKECYAVNNLTKQFFVKDSRSPLHHPRWQAVRVDPRLSHRWPLDHVGPPDLSPVGDGFRSQCARRARVRLADPLRRPCPVVQPYREFHRRFGLDGRARPACPMAISCRRSI